MLVTTEITAAQRRTAVRNHADVTAATLPDAELDAKILNGDDLAKTWLQQDTPERTLIILSNLLTAWLICSGIGGAENNERNRQLKDMAMKIVEIENEKGAAQNKTTITRTSGNTNGDL